MMKQLKSHFVFTKKQQNGILLLLLLIIIAQCLYFFIDKPQETISVDKDKLIAFQNEIDSLKQVEIEKRKPKIYPFNPNFISDYKGYTLGMSNKEIDRLLKFREQDKWINSSKQFQQVTQVSDSLLNLISPYFKFPEWVTNPKPKRSFNTFNNYNKPKSFIDKIDLNTATASQLKRVNGIGEKLSERIIRFRNKFKEGFIADIQLEDIYGLSPEVITRVTNEFTVKTPRTIQKINLNFATIEELVTIQHIDYDLANQIVEQRTLREGFKSFDELLKIDQFPASKIEIIKLYLMLN